MPPDSARSRNKERLRRAILDGARKVFLSEGYTASLDKIATEAGVARKSIFNMFGTKDNLFGEVLNESIVHAVDARTLDSDDDIEATIRIFADQYLAVALSDEAIALGRLVNAEYQRFPELIGRLVKGITIQMIPPLSAYFSRLIASGRIAELDPDMAAERLLASILGNERIRLSLGGAPESPERRRRYLDEAVRGFVRGLEIRP